MSSRLENEEEDVEMPKMKVVSKPKNLKKRKRENEAVEEVEDAKKQQDEEIADDIGISKLDEVKMVQQARGAKQRGSDMSSEGVQMSTMSGGGADGSSIASLTSHFTGQRAKVNTLDTRLEEFIEQEMAKRKAQRAQTGESSSQTNSSSDTTVPTEDPPIEVDEDEEEAKRLHALSAPSQPPSHHSNAQGTTTKSNIPAQTPGVIDLSNANLRATSSTQTASNVDQPPKRWHKSDGPTITAGILEVDLPVDEQLRMYEATRQAAIEALKNQKRKRRHHNQTDDFGDLDDTTMTPGNLSADFSRHKKHQPSGGGRATDLDALDKYKKKQAQMFR